MRFPGVFAESRAEAVLLMEGVNGLDVAGPDFSTDFIRSMVHEGCSRCGHYPVRI